MRWRTQARGTRVVRRFLWFPALTFDRESGLLHGRWLEWATVEERWVGDPVSGSWCFVRYLDDPGAADDPR